MDIEMIASKIAAIRMHTALGPGLPQHEGERGDVPVRRAILFKGENRRQRLRLPMLHVKV